MALQFFRGKFEIVPEFYFFLRGMHPAHPGSGVFFDRPPHLLVEDLDALVGGRA